LQDAVRLAHAGHRIGEPRLEDVVGHLQCDQDLQQHGQALVDFALRRDDEA